MSTIHVAIALLLGGQLVIPSGLSSYANDGLQMWSSLAGAIAADFSVVHPSLNPSSAYKPPRDIGQPRRTGPSGGRWV